MSRLDEMERSIRARVAVVGRPIRRVSLTDRMAELHVPATSLAVLDQDGVVEHRAWGATSATMFQAASISKPVAGMAAVGLAAEGAFDLDREVNDLLKTWRLPDGDGVTVRRILSHSAGLSVHGFPGYQPAAPIPSTVQILDGIPPATTDAVRVVRPPGDAFQYSGGGFTVLQLLLEDVTGEPFAALMRRVVLGPLAMSASTYEQPLPAERHSLAARGHDEQGNPVDGGWRVHPELAAAGLWTNPTELLRVGAEMLRPGRVLDERGRDAMLAPQIDDHHGLGWALEGVWFQHGGSNAGYRCRLVGSVAHQQAAVVMTNGDGGGAICGDVLATVAEAFGWPGYLQERTAIELDAATLDEIAGVYELMPGVSLSVRRVGDALVSSAPGLPEDELYAASRTELFRLDVDADIRWRGDALAITQGGATITAHRKS